MTNCCMYICCGDVVIANRYIDNKARKGLVSALRDQKKK